jgi:hypothetical protein
MEDRIKDLMTKLDCTREEAIEIIKDDDAIDHGEKLFELTAEQKKNVKEVTKLGYRKGNSTKTKRERKPDEKKRHYIQCLYELLTNTDFEDNHDVTITNPERQIDWEDANGRKFRIILSCPRK